MNGVFSAVPVRLNEQYSQVLPGGRGFRCKSIMVRPSISRGRGYAVVVKKDENEDIIDRRLALRTTILTRIGRFASFPKDATATIADLPDFLMQNIFSYTTDAKAIMKYGTVSKQWRRIINSTYVKKSIVNDRSVKIIRNPKIQALDTAKLKIFRVPATATSGIETTSQRKEDASFREVTIRVPMDGSDDGNGKLLNYLGRLAMYLCPTKECLLVNFELTDDLISFIFTVWQQKLSELRLFRCSFEKISPSSLEILKSKRLRHLYIDDCPITSTCPMADQQALAQLCQTKTRLEICFCPNESFSPPIDDQFLELLASGWKTKADIRWLKLRAPMITTDGIDTLIRSYFKLRYGGLKNHDHTDLKDFGKVPKLLLWLCDTAFDVDNFMSRTYAQRWFKEVALPTSQRRRIQDNYREGGDLMIWIENKNSK